MQAIGSLIITLSALLVYLDATNKKIGKIPDEKSFTNMPAGGWAVVTLLLWIIAMPVYLISRTKLIKKAKERPVEVPRGQKSAVIVLLGILVLGAGLSSITNGIDIEETAVPVVNQIIHEDLGGDASVQCVKVKLGEKFADNSYHATAIFNTGSEIKITIEDKGDKISVRIPNQ